MKSSFLKYLKERITNSKALTIIVSSYLLFLIISLVIFFVNLKFRNAFLCLGYCLIVPLMYFIEYLLKMKVGPLFAFLFLGLAAGGILGTCYELYVIFPFFDLVLHGLSGIIFGSLGFALMKLLVRNENEKNKFFSCLIFGIAFSLAIAVIWEIFEYSSSLFGFDMNEDTYIFKIQSYLLYGSHSDVVTIDNITHTIIYYGDNQSITINGYLDIGLLDTLEDMIICVIGTLVFLIISLISYFKFPKINEYLIPQYDFEKNN